MALAVVRLVVLKENGSLLGRLVLFRPGGVDYFDGTLLGLQRRTVLVVFVFVDRHKLVLRLRSQVCLHQDRPLAEGHRCLRLRVVWQLGLRPGSFKFELGRVVAKGVQSLNFNRQLKKGRQESHRYPSNIEGDPLANACAGRNLQGHSHEEAESFCLARLRPVPGKGEPACNCGSLHFGFEGDWLQLNVVEWL